MEELVLFEELLQEYFFKASYVSIKGVLYLKNCFTQVMGNTIELYNPGADRPSAIITIDKLTEHPERYRDALGSCPLIAIDDLEKPVKSIVLRSARKSENYFPSSIQTLGAVLINLPESWYPHLHSISIREGKDRYKNYVVPPALLIKQLLAQDMLQ